MRLRRSFVSTNPVADVRRFGSITRLRPEQRAQYLALHTEVWPAVEAQITRSHVRNYTIFLRDDLLFGYFEYVGSDYTADMAAMTADPDTQRWWALTDPCQERLPGADGNEQWAALTEIWHLD